VLRKGALMSFHELVAIATFPACAVAFVVVWLWATRGKARRRF
jgi:hypothetical protein